MLSALSQAPTQIEIVTLSEQLRVLWSHMLAVSDSDMTITEYIAMRSSAPANWQEIINLLQA